MKLKNIPLALTALCLFGATATPRADDIDLYTGGPAVSGGVANVLIVLDNTSNFSASNQGWTDSGGSNIAQGEVEADTISTVVGSLPDSVNVGVKMFADEGGGYPIYAVRPMSVANKTVFQAVAAMVKANVGAPAYKGPTSAQYGDLLNSAYRYFNGFARFKDTTQSGGEPSAANDLRDYSGNAVPEPTRATLGSHGYTGTPPTATNYARPADANAGCAKNYIIFIGNGYPSSNSTKFTSAKSDLVAAGALGSPAVVPNTTGIAEADSLNQVGPYWTKFMRYGNSTNTNTGGVKSAVADASVPGGYRYNSISTYTIDVCKNNCDADQASLLKGMAKYGGGKYFKTTDQAALRNALSQIFAEIQAVNSVFASATLPISVNTQGTYENQVYIGVFRPDGGARPRWYGNLKEYKFGRYCDVDGDDKVGIDPTRTQPITGTYTATDERVGDDVSNATCATNVELKLYLADQVGYRAIDETGNTGFIDLQTKSFWTSASSFWTHAQIDPAGSSDSPDGPNVERGAGAQRLRAVWADTPSGVHPDGRKIYTCLGTCLTEAKKTADISLESARTLTNADNTNIFYAGNALVTAALPVPSSTPKSVSSLTRSGNTATATTSTAHGYSTGDSVTIAGATPTDYNGTKTVTVTDSTHFTFSLTETPATSDSGTVTSATTTYADRTISSLAVALDTTTMIATATVTLGTAQTGLSTADHPVISGATQTFLNGAKTLTQVTGTTEFQFTSDLTPSATSYATRATISGATARAGSTTLNIINAYYDLASQKAVFKLSANINSNSDFSGSVTVRVTGAPAPYTAYGAAYSDWTYSNKGTACPDIPSGDKNAWFCVSLPKANFVTTPDGGSTKVASFPDNTSYPITITRSAGSTTATATIDAASLPHALAGVTSVNVTSASGAYTGTWTLVASDLANANDATFPLTPVTLGPATPASGTITATGGGATPRPATADIVNWMRGKDLWEDENLNNSLTDVRASIHGDVLHSRPAVINYGGTIGIVGFYGSNDGYLRAIHGGISNSDGEEKWAFIPSEFVNYAKLARQYNNAETVRFPNSSCSVSPTPSARTYFWDGAIAVYQNSTYLYYTSDPATTTTTEPVTGCSTANPPTCYKRPEKTYIYASMRRGGRSIYALDVSVPDAPKVLWKIDNTMTGFSQLGYTWSEPKLTRIKGKKADGTDDVRQVLVFGAGYDPTDDDQPSGCPRGDHTSALAGTFTTADNHATVTCPTAAKTSYSVSGSDASGTLSMGRGVFVVDALTGALINFLAPPSSATKYSFPADVTMIDMDGDENIDRIYAGDSGAQLFRFDVDSTKVLTAADAFKAYHLATFGDTDRSSSSSTYRNAARKFLFPPEVVPFTYKRTSDNVLVPAVMVLAGTGDREKPLPNRKSTDSLNTLECSALYSSSSFGNYFGAKILDRFYGLIDKTATLGTAPAVATESEDDLAPINTDETLASFNICKAFETTCSETLKKGWYMNFKHAVGGNSVYNEEKMVSAPKVISGMVLFGTSTPRGANPTAGICSNLGEALAYAVDPFTGMPKFDRDNNGTLTQADYAAVVSGGGLPPSVTAGVVGIGDSFYRFVIGGGGEALSTPSAIAGARNPISLRGTRSRVYWYYPVDEN